MTPTILERLTALCSKASNPKAVAAAGILRKLATDDNLCDKQVACAGHLKKLTDEQQARVVAAVESLVG